MNPTINAGNFVHIPGKMPKPDKPMANPPSQTLVLALRDMMTSTVSPVSVCGCRWREDDRCRKGAATVWARRRTWRTFVRRRTVVSPPSMRLRRWCRIWRYPDHVAALPSSLWWHTSGCNSAGCTPISFHKEFSGDGRGARIFDRRFLGGIRRRFGRSGIRAVGHDLPKAPGPPRAIRVVLRIRHVRCGKGCRREPRPETTAPL